jgi:hypothetical protein
MKARLLWTLIFTTSISGMQAQHVLTLMEGQHAPNAKPSDFAWLEGT